ncbi:bromodomain-containing protein DDB_G0270170-like [Penaeus japonicus]|uniref:bromodomain-containing protein DDB_G0270170-like n=1 Tax=Penaeus japonicus TaxID=27405 RepID=UPI001C712428|nr:bromodomain-containing protein DDB_G0270170-like [Penaeus japonicus]
MPHQVQADVEKFVRHSKGSLFTRSHDVKVHARGQHAVSYRRILLYRKTRPRSYPCLRAFTMSLDLIDVLAPATNVLAPSSILKGNLDTLEAARGPPPSLQDYGSLASIQGEETRRRLQERGKEDDEGDNEEDEDDEGDKEDARRRGTNGGGRLEGRSSKCASPGSGVNVLAVMSSIILTVELIINIVINSNNNNNNNNDNNNNNNNNNRNENTNMVMTENMNENMAGRGIKARNASDFDRLSSKEDIPRGAPPPPPPPPRPPRPRRPPKPHPRAELLVKDVLAGKKREN